ncbi:MAG: helix-turn-helix domain-containing protein [Parerythrobacter sp.]
MPLALNRQPGLAARPWFHRISVTDVTLPEGARLACRVVNELPTVRILFGSDWSAHTHDGPMHFPARPEGHSLFFGPQARAMAVAVEGSFQVVTVNPAAGAAARLGQKDTQALVNRIVLLEELSREFDIANVLRPGGPALWLDNVDRALCRFVETRNPTPPDAIATRFDRAALHDPTVSPAEIAAQCGVTLRTLERAVKRHFGLTPKRALRRARALDMVAMLLGVAEPDEEAEMRLRYFDEPHLNREMRHFFDLTPGQLRDNRHPLLRITAEIRQARRLEELAVLPRGTMPSWRDPEAEPESR